MVYAAIGGAGLVLVALVAHWVGARIRRRGMTPIDLEAVKAAGQRLATTSDGRRVAYVVYGRDDASAPVVVNIHGSGLDAGFEKGVHAQACDGLGCRGIAISLPGCGFTDQKPGRRVRDWPREDLEAVLDAEAVDAFIITGHSQGTPHAMAAAATFPKRCVGLGLNAPLLPTALCEELGLDATIGAGGTPTSESLRRPSMSWYFTVMSIALGVLPPSVLGSVVKRGAPKVAGDRDLLGRLYASMRRSVVRGTCGATWETAQDTCFDWGIDVRALRHANACVWHADDDSAIPASQGTWLAEHLGADHRHEAEGYGHMTYATGRYREPEHSMIRVLLSGRG
ncbi:MAG: alpha/beta hydrolase [Myxococcota bacterium]